MKTIRRYNAGFTLVEMLIAFGIFALIMVMSVGSLLSIIDANRQAQAKKTVVNNLHFALENMTRSIRIGKTYHCDIAVGSVAADKPLLVRDCASNTPANSFAFYGRFNGRDDVLFEYRQNGTAIERSIEGDPWTPITAPEVKVETLRFFVSGAEGAGQPRVLIVANGFMQGKARTASRFDVETLVSQRVLDI